MLPIKFGSPELLRFGIVVCVLSIMRLLRIIIITTVPSIVHGIIRGLMWSLAADVLLRENGRRGAQIGDIDQIERSTFCMNCPLELRVFSLGGLQGYQRLFVERLDSCFR
jgi:hypothetical protein